MTSTESAPDAGARVVLAHEAAFALGHLSVDPQERTIAAPDGTQERLEPRVMQVLVALRRAGGAILTREDLASSCWGAVHVGDDALSRVIARLRRLGESVGGEDFAIETMPRVGYRLIEKRRPEPGGPAPAGDAAPSPARAGRRTVLVAGAALAIAGGAAWLVRDRGAVPPAAPGPVGVAVEPFENVGSDPRGGSLGRGMARGLRDQLSRMAGIRVLAEGSSLPRRDADDDARTGYRVRGSVQRDGDAIRLSAALIDDRTGVSLWSGERRDTANALPNLQTWLTGAILRELAGRADVAADDLPPSRRRDGTAFRLTLEGEDLLEQSRAARMAGRLEEALDSADRAHDMAMRALAADGSDTGALLLLARLTRNGWTREMARQALSPEQRVDASIVHVTRALAIDPNDPAALTALGDYYRRSEWRWAEAETLFRKALAISPSFIEAHWSYGYLLGVTGRALQGLSHAAVVASLDPETTWRRIALPRLLYLAGDDAGTRTAYDRELRATPANLFLLEELHLWRLCDRDTAAIERLAAHAATLGEAGAPLVQRFRLAAAALRGTPAPFVAWVDASVAAYDARDSRIATRQARLGVDLLYIAGLEYAFAGASAKALVLLRRALAGRSVYWPATLPFGRAPVPPPLRDDPRYRALWTQNPRLVRLMAMRRRALDAGQIMGIDERGTLRRPSPRIIRQAAQRIV